MAGSWFFDENFNGVSEEFFDKVIDSLDFQLEDADINAGGEDWNAKFQCLETPSMDVLAGFQCQSDTSKLHRKFHNPYNRTTQLKQSAETTSSSSVPLSDESSDIKHKFPFKSSSPVSILESSSSQSVENPRGFEIKPQIAVKRARSKRTRPPRFIKQFILPYVSPASSVSEKIYSLPVSESDSDSLVTEKRSKSSKRKQKKRNLLHLSGVEMRKSSTQERGEIKKCMHCDMTSTPQWREGPMGPKTLCNACGVRYRSGRLFPEYRPAASPTFVPSVHSNSHKKVIEMRNKIFQVTPRPNMSTSLLSQLGNSIR